MPLIDIINIDSNTSLGIWQIDENTTPEAFCPQQVCQQLQYMCVSRQQETAAIYALLRTITNRNDLVIGHETCGRPFVDGYNIGISHTKGFACLILSNSKNVAVDIEYTSSRIARIKDKFLRPDEEANTIESLLLHWCAKETIYKYYSDNTLALTDIRVIKAALCHAENTILCENMHNNKMLKITYHININFTLTYCCE